ncbi:MAG TPA: NAD(P)H-dependent glycerol-3-phosphate dehydrogenase [Gammaproteobacteria bacterium]|nr:NAD(P)H-dependent glycerol-3-phosphate dehydrogenase [Gammaproteobacteria bacterium]
MSGSSAACAVLGAGSWGTALAILLARQGHPVHLWGHVQADIDCLLRDRANEHYLPGIPFPESLACTADLGAALERAALILVAVPSHAFATVLTALQPRLRPGQRIAWATKGLETGTGRFLHQVFADILGDTMAPALISGPTFAREVALGLPTAVTVASPDEAFADQLAQSLSGPDFRAYTSGDVQGVELGGAVKNVMAIAAGISDGLGFGANSRAALITRGLHEIMRLGETLGGQRETFMGLAGVGDLVLTCTDDQSRNRRLGLALGRGEPLDQAIATIGQAVEGVHTAREVVALARRHGVEMPISEQVCRVLFEGHGPHQAVRELLGRSLKSEM